LVAQIIALPAALSCIRHISEQKKHNLIMKMSSWWYQFQKCHPHRSGFIDGLLWTC